MKPKLHQMSMYRAYLNERDNRIEYRKYGRRPKPSAKPQAPSIIVRKKESA